MALFTAICVVELPALRDPVARGPPGSTTATGVPSVQPTFVLTLPHGDPSKLPKDTLSFCFPDLDNLARMPYHYDHNAEEYYFTLTPRDAPRLHGFVRRYRVGGERVRGRLDLTPYTSARTQDAKSVPAYQAICILSERPYLRFFSQCLQLLHAARLAGGAVALRLARLLLLYNHAPPASTIPLRAILSAKEVPGSLNFPKERIRVPASIGLPFFDVPLSPLLNRLDAPALLMLYVAMLCERRIIFVSQSIPTLTSCVHAAIALFQPFDWLNIFIPVLPSSFLMYCTAPNPYIIGLTPAQFTQLNEEYEIGDFVLVSLDEGYVACLNSALPLADLEGPSAGNNNTGYTSLCLPRAYAVAGMPASTSSSSAEVTSPIAATATATPVFTDASMSPFHSAVRTHAYDDDFVRARQHRKAFAQRRLQERRRNKEMVNKYFNKDTDYAAVNKIKESELRKRQKTAKSTVDAIHSRESESFDEPRTAAGWGVFVPDALPSPGVHSSAGASKGAVPISETEAAEIAASARRAGPIVGGSQAVIPETELDGSLANEIGTINLGVDLKALVSRPGDEDSIRRRKAAAARRVAALPAELAGLDMAATAAKKDSKLTQRAFGKMAAAFMALAGGNVSDDPGVQLALHMKKIYDKERKEGFFDEAAVYACILTFVAAVFGHVADYVSREPRVERLPEASPHASLRFSKETFVKNTVRHPTIARLMDEAQHSQWLQGFAIDWYIRQTAKTGASPAAAPNIVDVAMAEYAKMQAPSTTSSSRPGTGGGGGSGTTDGSVSGASSPSVASINFAVIAKKLSDMLASVSDSLADAAPLGTGTGVAGTSHTVTTALAGLVYAAAAVSTVSGRPPNLPAHMPDLTVPLVVTALRGLLSAATSSSIIPEESHNNIVKLAAAATFDPLLIQVVMGVLWHRMNDCSDKNWQHGYKALTLLYALLRVGSARVATTAVAFIPLLRFLMQPAKVLAVRAGYVAEEMGGQASNVYIIQGANIVAKARRGLFGAALIPGLPLSTAANPLSAIPTTEGAMMVARQASRVYLLLANPRRWLLERSVAIGPAAVSFGVPLALPLMYPLVQPSVVTASGELSVPLGWAPTPKEPMPPAKASSLARGDSDATKFEDIQKQVRAADAPWEQVHRVAAPHIASARSSALHALGSAHGIAVAALLKSPPHVQAAVDAANRQKAEANPVTSQARGVSVSVSQRSKRMRDALAFLSKRSMLPPTVKQHSKLPAPGTVFPSSPMLSYSKPAIEYADPFALQSYEPTFGASTFSAFDVAPTATAAVTSEFDDWMKPAAPTIPTATTDHASSGGPVTAAVSASDFDFGVTAPPSIPHPAGPSTSAPVVPTQPAAPSHEIPDVFSPEVIAHNGNGVAASDFDFGVSATTAPIAQQATSASNPFDVFGDTPVPAAPQSSTFDVFGGTQAPASQAFDAFGFATTACNNAATQQVKDPFAF